MAGVVALKIAPVDLKVSTAVFSRSPAHGSFVHSISESGSQGRRTPLSPVAEELSSPGFINTTPKYPFKRVTKLPPIVAKDKNDVLEADSSAFDKHIRELALLAAGFSERVEEIAQEFQGLKEIINQHAEAFESLEIDHLSALEALEEEKDTVADYVGKLRNAEVEIRILYQHIPEEAEEFLIAFSQAKSTTATYDRYA